MPPCYALAPIADSLPAAFLTLVVTGASGQSLVLPIDSPLALILTAVIAGYLIAHLVSTVYRVSVARRRHAQLLELLSTPHPSHERTRVLDDDRLLAYCPP